jgi:hypothetical protein
MTKTTRLWYVPLADVVETAGRAALLAAEFVDTKMLTPVAAAKLLRKEVKPGDVLALMDGTQLRALARVLVLEENRQRWRILPVLAGPKLVSAPAMTRVPDADAAEIRLPVNAVLRDLDSVTITAPVTSPEPPAGAPESVPDDTPFLPFTADTRTQNLLLHGPPGTGKTWALKERALQLAIKAEELPSEGDADYRRKLDGLWSNCIRREQVAMCTFHQAYTYEEFVEGIRPRAQDGKVSYSVEDGLFKKMSLLALAEGLGGAVRTLGVEERLKSAKTWLAGDGDPRARLDFTGGRQFVLVIDEINRANVARVMGELITLLEDDKRIGGADPLVLRLPASGERFAVPPNLHVIGTLNTADRSIALMDVALRRRFAFEEKRPDVAVLRQTLPADKALTALVVDLFTTINQRLLFLHDREHQIGHAYFLKVRTIEGLRDVMVKKVLPLLQEYFFGQWVRVALVLGHPMEDGGRTPKLTNNDKSVLLVTKIAEIQTLGFNHDDYEDQHTVEVHADFKTNRSREWLVKALVAIVETDTTKREQRVKAILGEAQPQATSATEGTP